MRKKPVGGQRKPAKIHINSCFRAAAEKASDGRRRITGAGYYDAAAEKTFFCWRGNTAEVWVGEFDHRSGQFGENRCVFTNETANDAAKMAEPMMIRTADGRPLILVCAQQGNLYRLTGQQHSVAEPFEENVIDIACEDVPCAVNVRDDIYLLYMRAKEEEPSCRTLCYIKSGDNGETWEAETVLADTQGLGAMTLYDARYLPNSGVYPSRIQFVWHMRDGADNEAVYLAYFSLEDFKVYAPAGKCLSELLCHDDMREQCVVFENAEAERVRALFSAALPGTGAPVVLVDETACITCHGFHEVLWDTVVLAEGECALYDLKTDFDTEDFRIACRFGSYAMVRRFDDGNWTEELRAELPIKKKTETVSRLEFMRGGTDIVGLLTTKTARSKRETTELQQIYLWIREPSGENR